MPSENFTPDANPVEPVNAMDAVPDAPPMGDAYDAAFAEQVSGIDDSRIDGMTLEPMAEVAPVQAPQGLDAQGDAMMALIEDLPISPGLGNELNAVEDSVLVTAPIATGFVPPAPSPEVGEAVVPPTAEATPTPKVNKEVPPDIASAYAERFGINPEDLKNMEGFSELSRGQQKQVLENLAQLTIGRIREEAADGHDKDIALEKANASKLGSKFLGKVWVGMKDSVTKKFDIVNREKKAATEIQKGGMAQHEVVLKQMVEGMSRFGPAIKEGANGELEVQFVETDGLNPDAKVVAESFNEQSTKLSKIPYEWSLDTATKEQQKAFKEAKEAYESTRDGLLMVMKESSGEGGEAKAVAMMAQTESQIEMQRFMQTAPDAAEELSKIEDQNAWTAALKSVGAERGYYMAGGALARAALGAMGGFVAAPLVAFGSAAIRGWNRTGAELVAQDAKQRKGEAPADSAKTAETKALIAQINESIANTTDENLKDQLKMDLYELNKSLRGTEKNMITASAEGDIAGDKVAESGDRRRGATAKIDYLKAQIASVEEMLMTGPAADEAKNLEEKKAKLTSQLSRRLDYTKQKISEGNMVFGGEKERLGNQYALMRSMAEAEMNLAIETAVDEKGDKVRERLARMLNATNAEIKDARFNKKLTQAIKAGAIGGAFAGLGATATDLVKWMNGGDSAIRNLVMGGRGGGAGGAIAHPDGAVSEIVEKNASVPAGVAFGGAEKTLDDTVTINSALARDGNDFNTPFNPSGLDALSAKGALSHEALTAYTPKPGDTMTSILKAKFPGITDTQIENLRTHDLKALGIKSGNLDRIGLTDKLDMGKIEEAIKAGKGSGIALRTPPAGGVVGKMFDSEHPDYRGPAGEREVYKNFFPETDTPRLVDQEGVPVVRAEDVGGVGAKLVNPSEWQNPDMQKLITEYKASHGGKLPTEDELNALGKKYYEDLAEEDWNTNATTTTAEDRAAIAKLDAEGAAKTVTPRASVVRPEDLPPAASSSRGTILEQQTGVRDPRLEKLGGVYEAKRVAIDMKEQQALREIESSYQRKLASLGVRHEQGIEKANVRTLNKGIGNIANIFTGRGDRAITSMTREITGRVQGGITGEMKHDQAIEKANFDYQSKIARAHEAFARARIKLDEKQIAEAAKIAAKTKAE